MLDIVDHSIELFLSGATMDDCCNPLKCLEQQLMNEYDDLPFINNVSEHSRTLVQIQERLRIVRSILKILSDSSFYVIETSW
jgi:hypothetical protein